MRPASISDSQTDPAVGIRLLENTEAPGAYFSWNKSREGYYLGPDVKAKEESGDAMESQNMQLG